MITLTPAVQVPVMYEVTKRHTTDRPFKPSWDPFERHKQIYEGKDSDCSQSLQLPVQ